MRDLRELSQEEIEGIQRHVLSLRDEGLSYSHIVRKIAEERNVRISKATVLRWCKGTHNTFNRTKRVNLKPSAPLAYIIGTYLGDATAVEKSNYRYAIRLKVVDREFAEAFAGALSEIGLSPSLGFERNTGRSNRWYVEAYGKGLFNFLRGPEDRLFEVAKAYPREFLRGFFDSEGSAIVSNGRARVEACNYDLEVIKLCRELLSELGILSRIYRTKHKGQSVIIHGKQYHYTSDLFTLMINQKDSVYRYMREVGFTIRRKQNKLLAHFKLL
ncbi:LAGLIDADG family homing endonuclease [Palaeococcus ferrophilus]|uniref:LAGLIDADG family homing endonuclease n=1 Tax=Palaeococcus ferrophilus TaxID=83868 RepID=UPI00064FA45B|nr:LAGLIDADG family homing endonuclease [Palaeococcus ferrophilus]